MNLMTSLFKTYEFSLANGLVDNHKLSNKGHVLLPIYHSNKRSNGEDIFEIEIDENGNSVGGRFLNKDEIIIFPITEESITRSGAKIAPHAICDELSYLSKEIDSMKNEEYLKGISDLLEYESAYNYGNFRIIGKYIKRNCILDDFLKSLLGNTQYKLDEKFNLQYEILENNKPRLKTLNLNKIFITFKIKKELKSDISLTLDVGLHNFYIDYVSNINKNKSNPMYCSITGKPSYCVERHRGIIGNAKLISISNNDETYYGRFTNGDEIYRISYEASQKVHNMLKYFLDSDKHKRFIGEDTYVINWISNDLEKGGVELISSMDLEDDEDDVEEITMGKLGDELSNNLGKYFSGNNDIFDSEGDFYVLIIEKISNGRVSIKYFRRLSMSEAYSRIMNWYVSTNWNFYGKNKSPSIYEIINFVYGLENDKGYMSCENKKLMKSVAERLIPCIIDSKKIPMDICRATIHKLSSKMSYKKSWNAAVSVGCSLIKKYKIDYENYNIQHYKIQEVNQLQESRSFYYGKLIAIYEKIEIEAIKGRQEANTDNKDQPYRITNADRLWNSMIRTPSRTRFILETKVKPYMNILKRSNPGRFIYFDKLITNITLEISNLNKHDKEDKKALDEDFILGYYYQKNEFYRKRDNGIKNTDKVNEGE